jgi:hypothetical protein
MKAAISCKTRYSISRTVLDQIGAHGLNTVGLAPGVAVKPHAFGVPLTRSGLDCAAAPGKGQPLNAVAA